MLGIEQRSRNQREGRKNYAQDVGGCAMYEAKCKTCSGEGCIDQVVNRCVRRGAKVK